MKLFSTICLIVGCVISGVVFSQNSDELISKPPISPTIIIGDRVCTNSIYEIVDGLTNSTSNIFLLPGTGIAPAYSRWNDITNQVEHSNDTKSIINMKLYTNYVFSSETNGFIIKHDTNYIRRIVKDGTVCSVIGHKWESGCSHAGCLVIHYEPIRHCVICDKTQTMKSDWQ